MVGFIFFPLKTTPKFRVIVSETDHIEAVIDAATEDLAFQIADDSMYGECFDIEWSRSREWGYEYLFVHSEKVE